MAIGENPSFLGDGFFFWNKFPPRYHPTQKETICRGQMLPIGNAPLAGGRACRPCGSNPLTTHPIHKITLNTKKR